MELEKSEDTGGLSLFNRAAHLTEREMKGMGKYPECFVML